MSGLMNQIIEHDRGRAAVLAHLRRAPQPVLAKELAAQTGLPLYSVGNYLRHLHRAGLAKPLIPRISAKKPGLWVAATPPPPPALRVPGAAHCPKGLEPADLEWMAYWRDRAARRAAQRAARTGSAA